MQRNSLKREPLDIESLIQSIEEDGGLAAVMDGMRRHQEISMRLAKEYNALLEKHPGSWVAMGETGLIAIALSFQEVLAVVRTHGLDTSEFAITFLDPDPVTMVL